MKVLKINPNIEMEFVQAIGDASQEEIDEILSEKGQQAIYESLLKEAKSQAKAVGANILNFNTKVEVVDI